MPSETLAGIRKFATEVFMKPARAQAVGHVPVELRAKASALPPGGATKAWRTPIGGGSFDAAEATRQNWTSRQEGEHLENVNMKKATSEARRSEV